MSVAWHLPGAFYFIHFIPGLPSSFIHVVVVSGQDPGGWKKGHYRQLRLQNLQTPLILLQNSISNG
jgi:hypothetical protein